jgi:hypothetical protein
MNVIKIIGALCFVVGLIILIMFAAADIFGIGENPSGFGTWQIGGSIIGAALIFIGLFLLFRKDPHVTSENPDSSN